MVEVSAGSAYMKGREPGLKLNIAIYWQDRTLCRKYASRCACGYEVWL